MILEVHLYKTVCYNLEEAVGVISPVFDQTYICDQGPSAVCTY